MSSFDAMMPCCRHKWLTLWFLFAVLLWTAAAIADVVRAATWPAVFNLVTALMFAVGEAVLLRWAIDDCAARHFRRRHSRSIAPRLSV